MPGCASSSIVLLSSLLFAVHASEVCETADDSAACSAEVHLAPSLLQKVSLREAGATPPQEEEVLLSIETHAHSHTAKSDVAVTESAARIADGRAKIAEKMAFKAVEIASAAEVAAAHAIAVASAKGAGPDEAKAAAESIQAAKSAAAVANRRARDAAEAEAAATAAWDKRMHPMQATEHHSGAKAALLQQTSENINSKQNVKCTGVLKNGRCWYLSELGENCKATCAKNGHSFSFAVADAYDPVTPDLVGHIPSLKQEPWASLECYVPQEDRYHTASANAARQLVSDIGNWKYDTCALACPCREGLIENEGPSFSVSPIATETSNDCNWKQPPACAPEFEYKGKVYTGCTTVDHDGTPWCMHHHHHNELEGHHDEELHAGEWSECTWSCGGDQLYTLSNGCEWKLAPGCVEEYDYEGNHFVGCTSQDHDTPWCSHSDPYDQSWDHCTYECPNVEDTVAKENEETQADNLLCSWVPPRDCSPFFEYKGIDYMSCTDVDHPTHWCSHHRRHQGEWSPCTRNCTAPTSGTVKPPTTSANDPCERHPEVENDEIGNRVALTEDGYQTAVHNTNSAINVKRFVCRVVDKLGCKVVDFNSLMGFVPYYSGAASHQTYGLLEHELEILCHAGGKWVQTKEER